MAHRGRNDANDILAASLAAGKTVRESAAAADVSEQTVYRRLADAAFQARVDELRASMVTAAVGRLADGLSEAADVLRKLLKHKSPGVRRQAAGKILDVGFKATELIELERRVKDLEARSAAAVVATNDRSVSP